MRPIGGDTAILPRTAPSPGTIKVRLAGFGNLGQRCNPWWQLAQDDSDGIDPNPALDPGAIKIDESGK